MSEQEAVDLETYLGVLDREQLQALIVQFIIKDPIGFDLLEEATQFLDHEQLIQTIETLVDVESFSELDVAIQPLRQRFQGYMKLGLHENALIVLYAFSNQMIMNIIETGVDPADEKLKEIIIELEKDWQSIAEVYTLSEETRLAMLKEEKEKFEPKKQTGSANPHQQKASDRILTKENTTAMGKKAEKAAKITEDNDMDEYIPKVDAPMTLMKIFEQLAKWRGELSALGPIFGDALRILKLRIVRATEAQGAAAKEAGAVSKDKTGGKVVEQDTKAAVPQGPTKRKGIAQPAAVKKAKK